jgi:uncharacterized protein
MLSEELGKLRELYDEGALSDEEYEAAKARLLGQSSFIVASGNEKSSELLGMTPSTYAMAMHLSQYAVYVIPLPGVIIPIAMWLYGRASDEFVNEHGRDLMNFLISYIIYVFIAFVLCFVAFGFGLLTLLVLLGWTLLTLLVLLGLIAPIFGAIAASKGESYRYPMTLKFF